MRTFIDTEDSRVDALARSVKGWVPGKNERGKPLTHTLMCGGGSYCIPESKHKDFLDAYANDLIRGKKLFINEIKTPVFNMFVDIDYKGPQYLSDDIIFSLASLCAKTFGEFYPGSSGFRATVCTAPPHVMGDVVKTGVHVHFQGLRVVTEEAQLLRSLLVAYLLKSDVIPPPSNTWEDAVDEAVYLNMTGLRMVGSLKTTSCPDCGGRKHSKTEAYTCDTCHETGQVIQNRPYTLKMIISDGKIDADLTDMYSRHLQKLVFLTSIRCPGKEQLEGFVRPAHCPSPYPPQQNNKTGAWKPGKSFHEKKSDASWITVTDKEAIDAAQLAIRTRFQRDPFDPESDNPYKHIEIATLKRTKSSKCLRYVAQVRKGTVNANWCINKGGNHSSNTPYFLFTREGVTQRCNCKKMTVRNHGTCENFESRARRLDWRHHTALFQSSKRV